MSLRSHIYRAVWIIAGWGIPLVLVMVNDRESGIFTNAFFVFGLPLSGFFNYWYRVTSNVVFLWLALGGILWLPLSIYLYNLLHKIFNKNPLSMGLFSKMIFEGNIIVLIMLSGDGSIARSMCNYFSIVPPLSIWIKLSNGFWDVMHNPLVLFLYLMVCHVMVIIVFQALWDKLWRRCSKKCE